MEQAQLKTAFLIKQFRERASQNDNAEYQEKRQKWLDYLSVNNFNPDILVCELYPQENDDAIKSRPEIYQYFNKYHNTRTKLITETGCETDKLPLKKSIALICEICIILIKKGYHFSVFYAQGQRSPHIRIYDFDELKELSPFQREKAQALFWKSIAPFFFHYLDSSIWQDNHFLCLEFAPHWKYGTIFDLLFEYLPEGK